MYSFLYDESETGAVWPNDVSLSEFVHGSSNIVVSHIFHQLLDGIRDQRDELKTELQKENQLLTNKVDRMLAHFDNYRRDTRTDDSFVTYDISLQFVVILIYTLKLQSHLQIVTPAYGLHHNIFC